MANEPKRLCDFPGQQEAKNQLLPSLMAAKIGKPMPHTLLTGPAGVGKTTLARIIANELNGKVHIEDARNLKSRQQFLNIVHTLLHNDVLFVDEIHGLNPHLEELLYGVVDEFGYYHTIGDTQIWIPLARFVLVGATTKPSEISRPLRTRFGITAKLEHYDVETMSDILRNRAGQMGLLATDEALQLLSVAARGTARVATKLLDRAEDLLLLKGTRLIDETIAQQVLANQKIDVVLLQQNSVILIFTST